ncbi:MULTISPECIES: Na+/H+ antiporter NhaC [Heyndrickxia]|jgi:NhaC family Na+:H+ antiporter|uniref:Na+/H+ antiporter NhaC n=1 Tax=Heyndrickxia oleronia TaxID=38875 RepID=A0A8E2IAM9_9BACI|nr:Na+/H+ antiporter NhaC [Heyndrickxia oleronia]NYV65997.1 Na+/H+ antiporter NhaC [Bacillus sp. Gen3]MBU5213751.1 Na+/H+ antiporter NhaC [Heyndrickxia oleronia]MCI1591434.1 Na+/H+ antiporter NhaC [Heyndrickxia oleronia]MCI1612185.1 Na+/H+ antiporter NhaC [Heyndrickxia oleronia]MCI1745651.1 Na+/H+ antiporter NhaC [Heyndrickxia oleronia]
MINEKEMPFWKAVIPLIVMIVVMGITIIKLEQGPHVPLIVGTTVAAIVALSSGFKWKDIEESMYKGIRLALPAVVIIMLVGITIGAWIGGGIVATMIYYGLKIITPSLFLVSITIICAVVALAIGSSWSTMGTIGVAGMGIGLSMGIPAPMIAGAIISGSYFGDKMSPLSDTTNLASGLTNTDLFVHIRHMLFTTIPGLVIALIVYAILGKNFGKSGVDTADIQQTIYVLQDSFVISPYLLIIPVLVIVLVAKKVPAIPALLIGIILGFLSQVYIQGGNFSGAIEALQSGFTIKTGNTMVDELFNRGGLDSMMYTVSMTIVAMTFGGILEHTGMLKAIVNQILKVAKSSKSLVASTVVSCFATNATCSEQYISIVIPSRMYANAYKEKGLHSKNLSRALEDGGTLTSVFVPWNTCGVFILGTLGVPTLQYAPYAVLNFVIPIISIVYALTGFTITKLSKTEMRELKEEEHSSINV